MGNRPEGGKINIDLFHAFQPVGTQLCQKSDVDQLYNELLEL